MNDDGVATDKLGLTFECGCFAIYYPDKERLRGGLGCCAKHEAANQKIENILPLTLTEVTFVTAESQLDARNKYAADENRIRDQERGR